MVITPVLRPTSQPDFKYIMIRIHDGGTSPKYKSTKCKIKLKDWNKKGNPDRKNWVKTTHPNHREYNKKIVDMMAAIKAELGGSTETTVLQNSRPSKGNKTGFIKYLDSYYKLVRNQATKSNVEQGKMRVVKYLESIDKLYLTFEDINRNFLKSYYNWLLDNYAASTTNQYFGVLRTVYNEGLSDESLNISVKKNPFVGFKYSKNKTTTSPLTFYDFESFKYLPTPKRDWQITKNLWLFQFSQGCRVNEIMFMQWKDFNYVDGYFTLDKFTSKTTSRIKRQLDLSVIELLITGIDRYYPEIHNKLKKIDNERNELITHVEDLQKDKPQPINTDTMLMMVSEGKSADEIKKAIEDGALWNEMIEDFNKEIEMFELSKRHFYRYYILQLRENHPNDYVWDKPQIEGLDINRMNKEDYDAYKRCLACNHGYLQRMGKEAGLKNNLASHVARYTASQFLLQAGKDFNQISKFLTHNNHATTELYVQRMGVQTNELSDFLSTHLEIK